MGFGSGRSMASVVANIRAKRHSKYRGHKKTTQIVKRVMKRQAEKMHIEEAMTTAGFNSIGSAWVERVVNNVDGLNGNQRSGDKIGLLSFEFTGVIVPGQVGSDTDHQYDVIRIVLATWTGNLATPMTSEGIGINTSITKPQSSRYLIHKYFDQYVPLKACTIANATAGVSEGYTPTPRKFTYKKYFKTPLIIQYYSTTATTQDHKLILSMVGYNNADTKPGFVAGFWKTTYIDM